MNIAWLTPEIPYPPIGGRNGVYNRIVQLSKNCNIFLFSIAYSEEEKNRYKAMEDYCREVKYYNRNCSKIKTFFKSLFAPYSVASRTLKKLQNDLSDLLNRETIDIIIVDFPNMAKNVVKVLKKNKKLSQKPYVTLNQHNIEYLRMREMYKIKTISCKKRFMYLLESYRLEKYEKKLYNSNCFKSITFFSESDLAFFETKWKKFKGELKLFPLGANEAEFLTEFDIKNHCILFVGRLDEIATTNVEAVFWFTDEILPKIKAAVPDVKFIIAGANPADRIVNLQSENIKVIPNYLSVNDVYKLTDIVVLPLKSGGGVKGKLLEAAAYKKIIVSTAHGAEGTVFEHNKSILLTDDSSAFADYCIDTLQNKNRYKVLANNAYNLFNNNYNWVAIGQKYCEYLKNKESNAD